MSRITLKFLRAFEAPSHVEKWFLKCFPCGAAWTDMRYVLTTTMADRSVVYWFAKWWPRPVVRGAHDASLSDRLNLLEECGADYLIPQLAREMPAAWKELTWRRRCALQTRDSLEQLAHDCPADVPGSSMKNRLALVAGQSPLATLQLLWGLPPAVKGSGLRARLKAARACTAADAALNVALTALTAPIGLAGDSLKVRLSVLRDDYEREKMRMTWAAAADTLPQLEILSGRKYYGKHATGHVVLVNGKPSHFAGKGSLKQARAFKQNIIDYAVRVRRDSTLKA